MRLTLHTDYALRVLLYLASQKDDARATIREIARIYRISHNHLVKVVHRLVQGGWVQTVRGRKGGLKLARDPAQIRLGEIVRATEPDLLLLECFDLATNTCPIAEHCALKGALARALGAFLRELDAITLADLISAHALPER